MRLRLELPAVVVCCLCGKKRETTEAMDADSGETGIESSSSIGGLGSLIAESRFFPLR